MNEYIHQSCRKDCIKDVFKTNIIDSTTWKQTNAQTKNQQLTEDKRWLQGIRAAQIEESKYHLQERKIRMADLCSNYQVQAIEKRERE